MDTNLIQAKKKVLLLHCEYLQKGGEDKVVAEEKTLLARHYEVLSFIGSNAELLSLNRFQQFLKMVWNRSLCRELQLFLQQHGPDIVHVHNTFLLFSPAVFITLGRWKRCHKGFRIVMTIHNFRLHCPQACLMRPNGHNHTSRVATLCQRCFSVGHFWPAIRSRCYQGSLAMTVATVLMLMLHKKLGTWHKNIDKFVYLNTTHKKLLTQVGFPVEKFVYKPNFLFDHWAFSPPQSLTDSLRLMFIGRLSEEKGLRILLAAIQNLQQATYPIGLASKRRIEIGIAGSGPLEQELKGLITAFEQEQRHKPPMPKLCIQHLGYLDYEQMYKAIKGSHFLVFPSIWYEGMPMVLVESLAIGRPVISFRLGACAEMLTHNVNGILLPFFSNLHAEYELDLAQTHSHQILAQYLSTAIQDATCMTTEQYQQMCHAARASFESHYTAERNLKLFQSIYEDKIAQD